MAHIKDIEDLIDGLQAAIRLGRTSPVDFGDDSASAEEVFAKERENSSESGVELKEEEQVKPELEFKSTTSSDEVVIDIENPELAQEASDWQPDDSPALPEENEVALGKQEDVVEFPVTQIETPRPPPPCFHCQQDNCDCNFGFNYHNDEKSTASSLGLLEERVVYLERLSEDQSVEVKRINDELECHGYLLKQLQTKIGWRCAYLVSVRDEKLQQVYPDELRGNRQYDFVCNLMRKVGVLVRGRYAGVDMHVKNVDVGDNGMKKLLLIRFPFSIPVCVIRRGFGELRALLRVDEINPYLNDVELTEYYRLYSQVCSGDVCADENPEHQ